MTVIKELIKPRWEVLEGFFQGVIQTHKVDAKEQRLENNPREFLKITYPSSAIKRILERTTEKLCYKTHQGSFLLIGPYGSGKSHALIILYHLFNNPALAEEWKTKWKVDFEIPKNSKSIIISTRRYDVDFLWQPIFKLLGAEEILKEIKRFPTVDQIEKAIGNEHVAIFIDEIENWYGSFDPGKQAHLIEQNETFLEHLLEVANDPRKNLFVFVTFLEEKKGLKKIFNRIKPVRIDVSTIEDREKVVIHRLFEDAESLDINKVEEITEKYIQNYKEPIKIDNITQYQQRMVRTYPFQPLLLDILMQVYEASTERQDIRGIMNVLADAVKDVYEKKDLILISDIDENAFRGIDLHLVEKYSFDLQKVKDIGFGKEILKTILIFTLNEKTHGANESNILLSIYSPTQGHTLNSILMDLENIYGKPHYLHKENGIYLFKHELNIYALLEKEMSKLDWEEVKKEIALIVKKDVFENRVFIYGYEAIPDDYKIKIVVSPESWGTNQQLKDKLNEFYKGKIWQNTYILVFPEGNTIFSFEVSEKAKRLFAAERLKTQVEDEKLKNLIQEERKSIAEKIKTFYGYFVKWVVYKGELTYRIINVSANVDIIREKASSDPSLCADFIVEEVKDKPHGIRIENLVNDFRKTRKFPLILDAEIVYTAMRNLHRDKRIIIQGERGKWYINESPRSLESAFVLFDPKYAPQVEYKTDETAIEMPSGETTDISGEYGVPVPAPTVERKEKRKLSLPGNSPRAILSQIEARTSEKDEFEEITVKYRFKTNISKQEIMKFLKKLPHQENCEIQADVIFWREKDEG